MSCRRYQRLIALNVGGELGPADIQRVSEHLESCGGCRDLDLGLRADREALTKSRDLRPDDLEMDAVRHSVLASIAGGPRSRPLRDRLVATWHSPALRPAAALLVVCLAVWFAWLSVPRPPATGSRPVPRGEDPRGFPIAGAPHGSTPVAREERPPRTPIAAEPRLERGFHAHRTGSERAGATPKSQVLRRIEIQTAAPDIRIIWLVPPGASGTGSEGSTEE
jgi:hypothetical protein